MPHNFHDMLKYTENIPIHFRQGNWSPFAHIFIYLSVGFLILWYPIAMEERHNCEYNHDFWIQTYRLVFGLHGLITTAIVALYTGPLAQASYTLTSWNLMTFRLLFAYLAGAGFRSFEPLADLLRFPALCGVSITVVVWWLVLVPVIHYALKDNIEENKLFKKFNTSFMLLNLHLANLPIAAIEFIMSKHALHFFDVYASIFVGIAYMIFYLNVLDANGFHFYIVFTPRTMFSFFVYGCVFMAYFGLYYTWNWLLLYFVDIKSIE